MRHTFESSAYESTGLAMAMQPLWIESSNLLWDTPFFLGSNGSDGNRVMFALESSDSSCPGWLLIFQRTRRNDQCLGMERELNFRWTYSSPDWEVRIVSWKVLDWLDWLNKPLISFSKYLRLGKLPNHRIWIVSPGLSLLNSYFLSWQGSSMIEIGNVFDIAFDADIFNFLDGVMTWSER